MGFNSGFIGLIAVCTVKNKRRNSSVIGGTEHVTQYPGGFGGLEVACWPLVPNFAGLPPAETVGFLGRKIPHHAFLRRGSKALGPMS